MLSDLIGGYLTFYLNQPIKWADFRLEALLADRMLSKLYTIGPKSNYKSFVRFFDTIHCQCQISCVVILFVVAYVLPC
jgi:hypothetical protein